MLNKATGWAVVTDKEILVRTVSHTRLAAVVNWLVGYSNHMLYQFDSQQYIFKTWRHKSKVAGVKVVEVNISLLSDEMPSSPK